MLSRGCNGSSAWRRAPLERLAAVVAAGSVLCAGCGGSEEPAAPDPALALAAGLSPAPVVERSGSWTPTPTRSGELSVLADTAGGTLRLHTAGGDRTYVPGVNIGATVPGRAPGEVDALTAEDYRAWFEVIGRLGTRVVRIYTIHPPAFYDELARYADAHPEAPLYLVQGSYFTDEVAYAQMGDLWDPALRDGFRTELNDAHLAVTGRLERAPQPGRASGRWTTDVSRLLAGWIVGIELDPAATSASDVRNAAQPGFAGRWFHSTADATPTERWWAEQLDHLAGLEAASGRSLPLAFVNWPTTDPLRHPDEPTPEEDMVQVDANHVLPTAEWPGGTFASYHLYPYFPDFQRYEANLQVPGPDRRPDSYRGYVRALVAHHAVAPMPVIVSELGVPSSWGVAHLGPLGRDQGRHNEPDALAIDADLMRITAEERTAGGFVFALIDEWFKTTWNTQPLQLPADRRPLWRDPMCNEANFGLVSADPALGPVLRLGDPSDTWRTHLRALPAGGPVRAWGVAHDEGYLYLLLEMADAPTEAPAPPVTLAFDTDPALGAPTLPDGTPMAGADTAVTITDADARLRLTAERDPVTVLEGVPAPPEPGVVAPWVPIRQLVNRARPEPAAGPPRPAEVVDLSTLIEASTDPASPRFDSRAHLWRQGRTLQVRLPWSALGFSDPSSKLGWVLGPNRSVTTRPIEKIGITLRRGDSEARGEETWDNWNVVQSHQRVKVGAPSLATAITDLLVRPG